MGNLIETLSQRISANARRKRAGLFRDAFQLTETTRILDLGSQAGAHIHSVLDGTPVRPENTYIADIVSGIRAAIEYRASSFEVINLGNNQTVSLLDMIQGLQLALGRAAELQWLPPQPGDVPQTWANVGKAQALLGYSPTTTYFDGVRRFADWLSSERHLTPQ